MKVTVETVLAMGPCYSEAKLRRLFPHGTTATRLAKSVRVPLSDKWWVLSRLLADRGPWAVVAWCESWGRTLPAHASARARADADAHTYAWAYARARVWAYVYTYAAAYADACRHAALVLDHV